MKRIAAMLLALVMLVMTGCGGKSKNIRVGAADIGGVYFAYSSTFAKPEVIVSAISGLLQSSSEPHTGSCSILQSRLFQSPESSLTFRFQQQNLCESKAAELLFGIFTAFCKGDYHCVVFKKIIALKQCAYNVICNKSVTVRHENSLVF
jgi:hypothetical protein